MMCERILLRSLFCLLWQLRTVSYYVCYWVNIFSSANYIMLTSLDKYFFRLQFSASESQMVVTYKVLTTNQPPYLHHLISVQPPCSTRSSSLVTLARPPTSSSLRIPVTDRSFRYASPCLWNQLPSSLRQPLSSPSVSDLPVHAPATSSYALNSPLSPSISPSLFHSRLKTYTFSSDLSHHRLPSVLRTDSTALWLDRFFWASRFLFSVSWLVFFCLVPCGRLSWLFAGFWAHVNILHCLSFIVCTSE